MQSPLLSMQAPIQGLEGLFSLLHPSMVPGVEPQHGDFMQPQSLRSQASTLPS